MGKDGPRFELEKSLEPIAENFAPYSLAFDPQNPDRLVAAYMPSPFITLWNTDRNISRTFGNPEIGACLASRFRSEGRVDSGRHERRGGKALFHS